MNQRGAIFASVIALAALLPAVARAQIPGTANIQVGGTNIIGGTSGRCLYDNAGKIGETASCGLAGGITVGTSVITGGTNGRILYDNSAVVGELVTGTGVATALGVNTGSAGAFVVNGGALGTPSAGTLTNTSGLPIGGITGLGTNQSTFLAANLTTSGALKLNGSGTPSQAASTDLSDTTAATTFTPTDTSGAALSFTSVTGNFGKTNKMCVGQFILTYPSTASGANAQISLPSSCQPAFANAVVGACRAGLASPRSTLMLFATSTNNAQFLATDSTGPTNANLSLAPVNCNFAYITN